MRNRAIAAAALVLLSAARLGAQRPDSVTVRSSTAYERSGLWRALFGNAWRPVWFVEVRAPVLDLGTYAGGLVAFQKGGNQSKTLRFRGANNRVYIFRSVDKDVQRVALPKDLRYTPVGDIIQDQTAAFHPTGSFAASELEDAVGIINARPTLVFLPDDKRLGEFREEFANTLGQFEERLEDAPKDNFAGGAKDIIGTENLHFKMDKSLKNRMDAREYLAARLIDFMIGDTDRGQDQWWWAQFDVGDFNVYRPIPRDRDYSFMRTEGLIMGRRPYPKMTKFGPEFARLESLTFMTAEFDRSHLAEVPWAAWDSVITAIQSKMTDAVIDKAVHRFPEPQQKLSSEYVRDGLRARREVLREVARRFYAMVSQDADVFGSDDDESAEIDRNADGSVTVRIYRIDADSAAPEHSRTLMYDRTFKSDETQNIRLYLERGDDRVIVRGSADRSIAVRVVGGEGDDVFIDSARVARGGLTGFYDATGKNTFVTAPDTRVDQRPYYYAQPLRYHDPEEAEEKPDKDPRKINEERRGRSLDLQAGYAGNRFGSANPRTWGKKSSINKVARYQDGPGVILGAGWTSVDYGFRRAPYESQLSVRALVGFSGDFGVEFFAERHFEASPWSVQLFAHATQLQSNRFFGYGNESPLVETDLALVMRDEVLVQPSIEYTFNKKNKLSAGPRFRFARPHAAAAGPAVATGVAGAASYKQAGLRADVSLLHATRSGGQQKGLDLYFGGSASSWDEGSPFGETHGLAKLFVPVGPATLALRAGGKRVWGSFPLQEAAYIGGLESLRGFWWNRYAGDAAAYGTAEVRLPVARITLLTRTGLGIIGFTDAGKVWMDSQSTGPWHTGVGGGLFLETMGSALSVTYAKGEEGRVNLSLGFPF